MAFSGFKDFMKRPIQPGRDVTVFPVGDIKPTVGSRLSSGSEFNSTVASVDQKLAAFDPTNVFNGSKSLILKASVRELFTKAKDLVETTQSILDKQVGFASDKSAAAFSKRVRSLFFSVVPLNVSPLVAAVAAETEGATVDEAVEAAEGFKLLLNDTVDLIVTDEIEKEIKSNLGIRDSFDLKSSLKSPTGCVSILKESKLLSKDAELLPLVDACAKIKQQLFIQETLKLSALLLDALLSPAESTVKAFSINIVGIPVELSNDAVSCNSEISSVLKEATLKQETEAKEIRDNLTQTGKPASEIIAQVEINNKKISTESSEQVRLIGECSPGYTISRVLTENEANVVVSSALLGKNQEARDALKKQGSDKPPLSAIRERNPLLQKARQETFEGTKGEWNRLVSLSTGALIAECQDQKVKDMCGRNRVFNDKITKALSVQNEPLAKVDERNAAELQIRILLFALNGGFKEKFKKITLQKLKASP